ncbi:MAG: TonB-dependent receptor plug domain-containing protein, partial [Phenylobacterium sp.]|nr:TonB-dependent receptor plug domain-containing protein [Phenylobacterium sp.]
MSTVSTAAVALALSLAAGQASAQTEVEEIVVTGSFIAGTPENAALPVDVISAAELEKQGSPSTTELIKSLTISGPVLGDSNQFATSAQGAIGAGSINMRGLGPQRTLVLFNGRRFMSTDPLTGVDTNLIPTAAIGRVELLKDGAAATYGSDAIGGVINFITKKTFSGFEVSGEYRYVDGSDGEYNMSA